MLNGRANLEAWKKFSAFQVFGDYAPMNGFRLVLQVAPVPEALEAMIEQRSGDSGPLDPVLARWTLRAGLSLVRSGLVSFVYATSEETVVVVKPGVADGAGAPVALQNRLLSMYATRLSLLAGQEFPASARVYEFPDVSVVRRALSVLVEEVEEATPLRSSIWLGAQLRGKGQPFHPSMLETLEEQTSLLRSHGIDMDSLPSWWWRGIAAAVSDDGTVQVFDDLPHGEELGGLVPE